MYKYAHQALNFLKIEKLNFPPEDEILAEDESSANYRQQLFKLTRRIIRLEKEIKKREEKVARLAHLSIGISVCAVVGVFLFRGNSNRYY